MGSLSLLTQGWLSSPSPRMGWGVLQSQKSVQPPNGAFPQGHLGCSRAQASCRGMQYHCTHSRELQWEQSCLPVPGQSCSDAARRPECSHPDARQTPRTTATPGSASGQRAPARAGKLTELANFVSFCWKEKRSPESENEREARQRRPKDVFNVHPIMQPSFPARSCLKTA